MALTYLHPATVSGRTYLAPVAPPAGTTAVTASFSASYAVRAAVSASLAATYRVLASVTGSKTFSYAVAAAATPVTASFTASYQVQQAEHPFVRAQARTHVIQADDRMGAMPRFKKGAGAKLDYSFDWRQYLADSDDAIQSYSVTGPVGLVMGANSIDGAVVTTWVRGGIAGYTHRIVCEITTGQGRIDARAIEIEVVTQR
jgi:hypothetical protein